MNRAKLHTELTLETREALRIGDSERYRHLSEAKSSLMDKKYLGRLKDGTWETFSLDEDLEPTPEVTGYLEVAPYEEELADDDSAD